LASEASALSNAGLVYPDDIAFAPEGVPEAAPSLKPEPEPSRQRQPILPPKFEPRAQPMARPAPSPVPPYVPLRPSPTAAQAAAMPDPMLSTDIAAQLIEPATDAAVRNTFSKLNKLGFPPANTLGVGGPGLTIEAMVREMLRPMLKEWLDDNLPAVVERMVEKEIGRISRGA
jgi:cell pole-organizing protein PopZ